MTNFPIFMQCLPGGLYLPDEVGLAATLTQAGALVLWWTYTSVRGVPSFHGQVAFVWGCLASETFGALLVAFFWQATMPTATGRMAIVVIVGIVLGGAVGTLSWAAVLPFISMHYAEHLISAFYTGSTSGSLLAGLLGLLQGSVPAFGPSACLGTLALCLCASIGAFAHILRHTPHKAGRGASGAGGARVRARISTLELTSVSDTPVPAAPSQHDGSHHKRAAAEAGSGVRRAPSVRLRSAGARAAPPAEVRLEDGSQPDAEATACKCSSQREDGSQPDAEATAGLPSEGPPATHAAADAEATAGLPGKGPPATHAAARAAPVTMEAAVSASPAPLSSSALTSSSAAASASAAAASTASCAAAVEGGRGTGTAADDAASIGGVDAATGVQGRVHAPVGCAGGVRSPSIRAPAARSGWQRHLPEWMTLARCGEHLHAGPRHLPEWVTASLPCWLMAVPMNCTTWGFSPNIVNIAAAHAGCSCDPHEPAVALTYRVTVSLAYTAMPLAAWLSYVCPTHELRVLALLASLQALAFVIELLGAANAPLMSCSSQARTTLVLCVVTMRSTDTYVTAMLFRVVTRRTAHDPRAQQVATLVFGQMLVVATLAAGLWAIGLVNAGSIVCRLGDGSGSRSANAAANQTAVCPVSL